MPEKPVNDIVTLVKKNGIKYTEISAIVRSEKIFIDDGSLPIEEGDKLIHHLPNGWTNEYLIVQRGFCPALATFPAHFQCTVKRLDEPAEKPVSTSSPFISTPSPFSTHATIFTNNQRSRFSPSAAVAEVFNQLRALIKEQIKDPDQKQLLASVDLLEQTLGTADFVYQYKAFMTLAAHHIHNLAPIIPALSQMLG